MCVNTFFLLSFFAISHVSTCFSYFLLDDPHMSICFLIFPVKSPLPSMTFRVGPYALLIFFCQLSTTLHDIHICPYAFLIVLYQISATPRDIRIRPHTFLTAPHQTPTTLPDVPCVSTHPLFYSALSTGICPYASEYHPLMFRMYLCTPILCRLLQHLLLFRASNGYPSKNPNDVRLLCSATGTLTSDFHVRLMLSSILQVLRMSTQSLYPSLQLTSLLPSLCRLTQDTSKTSAEPPILPLRPLSDLNLMPHMHPVNTIRNPMNLRNNTLPYRTSATIPLMHDILQSTWSPTDLHNNTLPYWDIACSTWFWVFPTLTCFVMTPKLLHYITDTSSAAFPSLLSQSCLGDSESPSDTLSDLHPHLHYLLLTRCGPVGIHFPHIHSTTPSTLKTMRCPDMARYTHFRSLSVPR